LVNTHLTTSEIAYVVDDCAARALISSAAMRVVCQQLSGELIRGLPAVALLADAELEDFIARFSARSWLSRHADNGSRIAQFRRLRGAVPATTSASDAEGHASVVLARTVADRARRRRA
jgi:hypothetical protein